MTRIKQVVKPKQVIGQWKVLRELESARTPEGWLHRRYYECACVHCKKKRRINKDHLFHKSPQCECSRLRKSKEQYVGVRCGMLVILDVFYEDYIGLNKYQRVELMAKCRCDCGKITTIRLCSFQAGLLRGSNKSCGCAKGKERRLRSHQRSEIIKELEIRYRTQFESKLRKELLEELAGVLRPLVLPFGYDIIPAQGNKLSKFYSIKIRPKTKKERR